MSGFSSEWLALREPVDHRARAPRVRDHVVDYLAPLKRPAVLDLGCGGGSNLRALAPCLGASQLWRLVDHDAALLRAARAALIEWADCFVELEGGSLRLTKLDKSIDVFFETGDLAAGVDHLLKGPCDLVTAAAFFDLAGPDWIARFCADAIARRKPLYATLTYNGVENWEPARVGDDAMLRAFHAHQHGDKGLGVAAGPDAHRLLVAAFTRAGWDIVEGDSPWKLGAADSRLIATLAEGSATAVAETGRVDPRVIEDWLASRRAAVSSVIGHDDLFASPR